MAKRWDFKADKKMLAKVKRRLPILLANNTEKFFKENFRRQGFKDRALKKWAPRRPDTEPGRAILIKTGALMRSIRRGEVSFKKIVVGTQDPKAKWHNRETSRTQRQFIGNSVTLRVQNARIINRELKKVFA